MALSRSDVEAIADSIRAWVIHSRGQVPHAVELAVTLVPSGEVLRLSLPATSSCQPTIPPSSAVAARHGPDFRSVNWFGTSYTFTATQAAVVKVLWEAWENDTPDVGQETLLEKSGAESQKVSDIFKDHPAWGRLIVSMSRGAYRLAQES